jgi:hypothetical protein
MEKIFIGFCARAAKAGNWCDTHMPITSGRPSRMTMSFSMTSGSSEMVRIRSCVTGLRLPQKLKFSGVITMASAVDTALALTDSAVLPRDRWVRKFDRWPAGQDDTRIMPSAMLGIGLMIQIST